MTPSRSTKQPLSLQPGDIIDIVAPSSKCHPDVAEKFKNILQTWGLVANVPEGLFGESLLYANSDEMRFLHLKNALLNPRSKAVWCLLGGYGSARLIPMLSALEPPSHSKLFIGFSDITALHIFLQQQWGWSTISGPSGYQISLNKITDDSVNAVKRMLLHYGNTLSYQDILPLNKLAAAEQIIEASVIGGNLHLIQASLGTNWQINPRNKIFFIEEINERAYRVDRILAQLDQAGIFQQATAVLFGDMIDKGEPNGKFLIQQTIQEFAQHCPIPVLQTPNFGHGSINYPLLLGQRAKLTMGASAALHFFYQL